MYCSISCSRAWRSPSSWYRRRRTLSLSATRRDLLREAHPLAVDLDAVDDRVEHAAQAELLAVVARELVAEVDRTDLPVHLAVVHRHRDRDLLAVVLRAFEDRLDGDLQVLEVLER